MARLAVSSFVMKLPLPLLILVLALSGCNRPVGQAKPFPADFAWGAGNAALDGVEIGVEEVGMLAAVGLTHYRFGISWERLIPDATGRPDPVAVAAYNQTLDALLEAGIKPVVVLYERGLPNYLEERGGWGSPDSPEWFSEYAEQAFGAFGDRVAIWVTMADPFTDRLLAYALPPGEPEAQSEALSRAPPFVQARRRARQINPRQSNAASLRIRALETHHMLMGHAAAVEAYEALGQDGSIGIAIGYSPVHPVGQGDANASYAELEDGIQNRWFLEALINGSYPADVLSALNPAGLDPARVGRIAASPGDFLGIEYFAPTRVEGDSLSEHLGYRLIPNLDGDKSAFGEADAAGMYDTLTRIATDYPTLPIMVLANGAAYGPIDEHNENGRIRDELRVRFLRRHLVQAQKAAAEGANLRGYIVWSAFDPPAPATAAGLFHRDPESGAFLFKDSARYMRSIVAANAVSRMPF
ncbi:MAG: beta-glucosidase [Rhodothermales bacterium]|jgi:beta-glucosidase